MKIASAIIAVACAGLGWSAYTTYAADRDLRVPVARFADQFQLTVRRPDVATTLAFAPSADFAMDLIADATLRDVTTPARLRGLPPETRLAWIDAVGHYDEQIARAIEFTLDAAAYRPGWPYHAALLGQLVYTRGARSLSADLFTRSEQWKVPLQIATAATPHDPLLWEFMALAYLQTWPALEREHRDTAPVVFRHAFEDGDFVAATFTSATQLIGTDAAIGNLPESPKPLWAAFDQLAKSGDMQNAWRVHQRWDAVEWKQRGIDLALIEKAATRGDVERLRRSCSAWIAAHPIGTYDSSAAHAQLLRLLELWPASDSGAWARDARADVIRYFLAAPQRQADTTILVRTADALDVVPMPVEARLHVLAGDIAGGAEVARHSESLGSFEWTPYTLDLARYWFRRGKTDQAKVVLQSLPEAARAGCDPQILNATLQRRDTNAEAEHLRFTWQGETDVPVCYPAPAATTVTITTAQPAAIIDYGFDGGRSGTLFVQASQSATVMLPVVEGLRTLSLRAIAGTTALLETSVDIRPRAGNGIARGGQQPQ